MDKEQARERILSLVTKFESNYESYKQIEYNETQTRREFIDPFFKALGWDIDNEQGIAEAYKEVIHEDRVKVGGDTKAPDYCFTVYGQKKFFVEAKKPSVKIKDEIPPAYQVRRYGWSAKLAVSLITDFEEFAVYDCTKKPSPSDKAAVSRIEYFTFRDYVEKFDFLWNTFSKEGVLKGNLDRYLSADNTKKGTAAVDREFLKSMDEWRKNLATNIALRNASLSEADINRAVQLIIDRLIFLRICEDRMIEPYGAIRNAAGKDSCYSKLSTVFIAADQKYNSGLFDFNKDKLTPSLGIDDKVMKAMIAEMYYPECPYQFDAMPVEILGNTYEQFLGKVIRLTDGHRAKIEEKPEVRKAGGVYYTPQYIVDYIVKHTVGELLSKDGMTPDDAARIKVLDPACGSGSFLLGAYQHLLDWHLDWYKSHNVTKKGKLAV
ncbi:MAG TPA: type I restriction endonuclease, partial [Spirochaetota bacterium]|nr:type I restriction endonuclease [Spirochaetota bacterium]